MHFRLFCYVTLTVLVTISKGSMCPNAIELGSYGIAPWGTLAAFADPSAKWLEAPVGSIVYYLSYTNEQSSEILGKLHIIGNALFQVTVNGISLGNFVGVWNSSAYTKIPISLVLVSMNLCCRLHHAVRHLISPDLNFWNRDRMQCRSLLSRAVLVLEV